MLLRETSLSWSAILDEIPLSHLLMIAAGVAKASGRTFAEPDYSERELLNRLTSLHGHAG